MRQRPLPFALVMALYGACGGDPVAADSGSDASGDPPGATADTTTDTSTPPGQTSAVATTSPTSGDSTATAAPPDEDTGPVEPPTFDVGAVPDVPGLNPFDRDVHVLMFADGAYVLAYGTIDELTDAFEVVEPSPLPELCHDTLELHTIPRTAPYIYVVAYADEVDTHGLLGVLTRERLAFHNGPPPLEQWEVYTGDSSWMVCATGQDRDPGDPPPSQGEIENFIIQCNLGNTDPETTSAGWVDRIGTSAGALAVGEQNNSSLGMGPQPGNEFPLVCADWLGQARWMWFNWAPEELMWPMESPFIHPVGEDNPAHEFLIFRLPREAVPH